MAWCKTFKVPFNENVQQHWRNFLRSCSCEFAFKFWSFNSKCKSLHNFKIIPIWSSIQKWIKCKFGHVSLPEKPICWLSRVILNSPCQRALCLRRLVVGLETNTIYVSRLCENLTSLLYLAKKKQLWLKVKDSKIHLAALFMRIIQTKHYWSIYKFRYTLWQKINT